MKRIISIFILLFLILTLGGCSRLQKNETDKKNTFGVFKEGQVNNQRVHLILYFPDKAGKYLIPEERLSIIDKYIEQTIAEEMMKGSSQSERMPWSLKGVRVLSVSGRGGILTLNLSGDFVKALSESKGSISIIVYGLINSLTELPGVKGVLIKSEGKEIANIKGMDFSKPLTRNRAFLNRDKTLKPNQVLEKEMTFEKNGRWLDSYLLMSDDENNPHRKYFEAYVQEMQEMKDNGFLNAAFEVGDYKVDPSGKTSRVHVTFGDKNNSNVDNLYFNTIKIDGAWLVDWITGQQ